MNRIATISTIVLALAAGCYAQQKPVEPPLPPAVEPQVVQWLDQLEARGRKLHTLTADVIFDKINALSQDRQTRMGSIAYVAADADAKKSARFAVDFKQRVVNGALRPRLIQYIFDGTWLVEKNHDTHMFQKRQVVAPGETFDPMSIDGPFPLPLGQKRDAVLSRFFVEQVADPPVDDAIVHLRFTPLPGVKVQRTDGQKDFNQIDMWFDREQLLPMKIIARQTPYTTTVKLSNMQIDTLSDEQIDTLFDTDPPDAGSGWDVDIRPLKP